MSSYTPDSWVVVKMTTEKESINKVLAGWYGGFAYGDSWKMSSGIEETKEFDDRYEFTNYSGSVYVCYKSRERMSGMMAMVFSDLANQIEERNTKNEGAPWSIEIIEYDASNSSECA